MTGRSAEALLRKRERAKAQWRDRSDRPIMCCAAHWLACRLAEMDAGSPVRREWLERAAAVSAMFEPGRVRPKIVDRHDQAWCAHLAALEREFGEEMWTDGYWAVGDGGCGSPWSWFLDSEAERVHALAEEEKAV